MLSPVPVAIGISSSLATTYDPSALTGIPFCAEIDPSEEETASMAAPINAR
jgi:hypothetical protein